MNSLKEIYFTSENIDREAGLLREEINVLPFRPGNWNTGIHETALIVTDLQNYFFSPESHAFIPSAPVIIPKIRMLMDFFQENQRPVIFTRHINDQVNARNMSWWWKDLIAEGTFVSKIISDVHPGNSKVLVKHQYDAFYGTELEKVLLSANVKFPVICGVMTNLCCETTVRSAFSRGFRPVLPLDATATYHRQLHIATFRNLAFGFSPVLTSAEVIGHIS